MIQFRCWFCNRRYAVREDRVGERLTCSCDRPLRVPRRSGGSSRAKTPVDRLVEAVVYGGAGGLLGLGLAVLLLSQFHWVMWFKRSWLVVLTLTAVGFAAGLLGGERGVEWLGRRIREREDR
jgi:hypothetical protein